jgi:hypothetical protein
MSLQDISQSEPAAPNPYSAAEVAAILQERGWLVAVPSQEQLNWCERAAFLLGPQAADRAALADLLALVFHYDAREILARVESHAVLSRSGAREVIRLLALLVLEGGPVTSERFKEIATALKERLDMRSRDLFHPIRLALAGCAGTGAFDRVILLLDGAAGLPFAVAVKSARERMLEFCSALD